MTPCQHCNAKLITEGLDPGQQISCPQCQTLSRYGEIQTVATHRLAWRSFWLGLSSILLLFITGIPAIYYGIKSLLRMRFVKPKPSDKAAAIAGTALGGCFGIVFGATIVTGFLLGLLIYLTNVTITEPDLVVTKCHAHFVFQPPSKFVPVYAKSSLGDSERYLFANEMDAEKRSACIYLTYVNGGFQADKRLVSQALRRLRIDDEDRRKPDSSEVLTWTMNGSPIEVRKRIYATATIDSIETPETRQYYGYLKQGLVYYGMSVAIEPESCSIDEEDVRKIFAGLRLPNE